MSWPDASDDRLVQRITPAANCTAHRSPIRRDARAQKASVSSSDNLQSSVDLHWCVDSDFPNLGKCTSKPMYLYDQLNSGDGMVYSHTMNLPTNGNLSTQRLPSSPTHPTLASLDEDGLATPVLRSCASSTHRGYAPARYELMSRDIDATLAQVDMETFRTIDINSFLSNLSDKFASVRSSTLQNENHANTLHGSISDSFLSEIEQHTDKLINYINESNEKHTQQGEMASDAVQISVDSLDMSHFERQCNEMLNRCTTQDKARYKIAFEKSLCSSIASSTSNERHHESPSSSKVCRDRKASQLTKSCFASSKDSASSLAALVKLMHRSIQTDTCNPKIKNDCIEGYALNSSCNSASDSSVPTSLIKLFMQTKHSPNSSAGLLSSASYDSGATNSSLSTPTHAPTYTNNSIPSEPNLLNVPTSVRQTSPITEEEDTDQLANDTCTQRTFGALRLNEPLRQKRNIDLNLQTRGTHCPRSFSMEEFGQRCAANVTARTPTRKLHSRECSVSSGYLSGGCAPPLCDWTRKAQQQQMNATRNCSTQMPAKAADKEIQTSITMSRHSGDEIKDSPSTSQQSARGPIYVYYPNYSLPDLQFVSELVPFSIDLLNSMHLSPTKFRAPTLDTCVPLLGRPRNRPKSCGDFSHLNKEQFKHIKDWESLHTLLPDEFKQIIEDLKIDITAKSDQRNVKRIDSLNGKGKALFFNKIHVDDRCRPRPMPKGQSLDSNLCGLLRCDCSEAGIAKSKRFSLQECEAVETQGPPHRRGMIKSATMNMPVYNAPHHQYYAQPTCSGCCCHQAHGTVPYSSTSATPPVTSHCGIMNETLKLNTPLKPCNAISEQNEESETYEMLLQQRQDFDEILLDLDYSKKQVTTPTSGGATISKPVVRRAVSGGGPTKQQTTTKESKGNFKDLRNHWETIAKKPKDIAPLRLDKVQSKIDSGLSRRRPVNGVKPRARSKSPPKSSKEVVILTKRTVPPPRGTASRPVPNRPVNESTPRTPKRPNNFNTQFKSMIPVVKGSRSPSQAK